MTDSSMVCSTELEIFFKKVKHYNLIAFWKIIPLLVVHMNSLGFSVDVKHLATFKNPGQQATSKVIYFNSFLFYFLYKQSASITDGAVSHYVNILMCIIKESRTSLILSGTKTNAVKNIQEALNVSKRSARGLAQNAV